MLTHEGNQLGENCELQNHHLEISDTSQTVVNQEEFSFFITSSTKTSHIHTLHLLQPASISLDTQTVESS